MRRLPRRPPSSARSAASTATWSSWTVTSGTAAKRPARTLRRPAPWTCRRWARATSTRPRRRSRAYAAETGAVDVSTLREPYRIEGKKTLGLELAEQLGWTLPDAIVYPTGGGTGLIGMWKAFQELV